MFMRVVLLWRGECLCILIVTFVILVEDTMVYEDIVVATAEKPKKARISKFKAARMRSRGEA